MFGIVVIDCLALNYAVVVVALLIYEWLIRPIEELAEEQGRLEQKLKDIEENNRRH